MHITRFPKLLSFYPLIIGILSFNRFFLSLGLVIAALTSLFYFKESSWSILPNWLVVLVFLNPLSLILSNLVNEYSILANPQIYYVSITILTGSIFFSSLNSIFEQKIFIASCFMIGPITYFLGHGKLNIWKYYLGMSVVFWILFFIKRKFLSILLLIVSFVFSWTTRADSLSLITILSIILIMIRKDYDHQMPNFEKKKFYSIIGFLTFICIFLLILDFYSPKFTSFKNILSIILTGRSEFWMNIEIIRNSPILGRGSAYFPSSQELYAAFDLAKTSGFSLRENIVYYWGNPNQGWLQSHSWIATYWIKGGLGAIMIWIGLLGLNLRILFQYSRERSVAITVASCILIWDILFSPVNALSGFEVIAFLGLLSMEKNRI